MISPSFQYSVVGITYTPILFIIKDKGVGGRIEILKESMLLAWIAKMVRDPRKTPGSKVRYCFSPLRFSLQNFPALHDKYIH